MDGAGYPGISGIDCFDVTTSLSLVVVHTQAARQCIGNGILRMRRRKAPSSGTLPLYFDDEGQARTASRRKRLGRSWPNPSWLWCLPVGFVVTMAATWWVSHLSTTYPQSPTRVICPNGAIGYLNDDYCDCLDGSDEPSTSACSHVTVQRPTFHCADGTAVLFASRVKDGVRDCLDGSDELELISLAVAMDPRMNG